jgi:anti-sigma factor RsiW
MTAYLDGELPAPTAALVLGHVEQCHSCAEELQGLEESASFMDSGLNPLELDPRVWQHVRARITVEAPVPRPGFLSVFLGHRWVAATATLAAAAVLALGIWSYRQHQLEQRDLEQYMSDYLQSREKQDVEKRPPVLDIPEDSGNPFMTIRANMIDNPFRQEAK